MALYKSIYLGLLNCYTGHVLPVIAWLLYL